MRLRLIDCSQIMMIRTLLVKERVVRGFIVSTAVILRSKNGKVVEERKFLKIQNWSHYSMKTRVKIKKVILITASVSKSYFQKSQSRDHDSGRRKLGTVRDETRRC